MTNAYVIAQAETARDRRERLILDHLPQVHLIARRLHERLPDSVCLDDLVSTGIVGLISAVDNFEEVQGVQLKTYAEYKIRGAILDSLRGLDWASRHRRKKAKHIEAAISSAEHKLQRAATEEEVAAELGLSLAEYHERQVEVQGLNLTSLEVTAGPNRNQTLLSMVPDTPDDLPSGILERAELERLLAEAIAGMPETERTVLSLYYHEELTLREIGEVMGWHTSRVSVLKTHSILRLRAHMKKKWPTTRGI
ncbi:MAG: FliA/WhiG family RNA polymerase sigma factor [Candidatus Solibacter sp.]